MMIDNLQIPLQAMADARIAYTLRLYEVTREHLIHGSHYRGADQNRENAAWTTFYRMFLCVYDLTALNDAKHFQSAAFIARCTFELLLDIKRIETDPGSAQPFFDFMEVKRIDLATTLRDHLPNPTADQQVRYAGQYQLANDPQSVVRRTSMCARNGWLKTNGQPKKRVDHWWGESAEDRARITGAPYHELFCSRYSLLSQYVHPGGIGIINLSPEAFTVLYIDCQIMTAEAYVEGVQSILAFREPNDPAAFTAQFGELTDADRWISTWLVNNQRVSTGDGQ